MRLQIPHEIREVSHSCPYITARYKKEGVTTGQVCLLFSPNNVWCRDILHAVCVCSYCEADSTTNALCNQLFWDKRQLNSLHHQIETSLCSVGRLTKLQPEKYGAVLCVDFAKCVCVCVLVLLCVGVLVICVLVFTVFVLFVLCFCIVSFRHIIYFV